jgi:pyruvate carboxylase
MVNGPLTELGTNLKPANIVPHVPEIFSTESSDSKKYVTPTGWRDVFLKDGPKSFAKAIRDHTKSTHQVLLMGKI